MTQPTRLPLRLPRSRAVCRQEQYGGVLSSLRVHPARAAPILSGASRVAIPVQAPKAAPNKRARGTAAGAATGAAGAAGVVGTAASDYYDQIDVCSSDDDDDFAAPSASGRPLGGRPAAPSAAAAASAAAATASKAAAARVAGDRAAGKRAIDQRLYEMALEALTDLRKYLAFKRQCKPDSIFNMKMLESIARTFPT